MIVKVCFGDKEGHCQVVECHSLHFEENADGFVEMLYYGPGGSSDGHGVIHLGQDVTDNVYIMDKGKTVDRMVFHVHKKS